MVTTTVIITVITVYFWCLCRIAQRTLPPVKRDKDGWRYQAFKTPAGKAKAAKNSAWLIVKEKEKNNMFHE